jgi:hypothetical protein
MGGMAEEIEHEKPSPNYACVCVCKSKIYLT